jgi:hypothetical protein
VGLRHDVLIGRSTPTTAALEQETATIPIIFVNVLCAEPPQRRRGRSTNVIPDRRGEMVSSPDRGDQPTIS